MALLQDHQLAQLQRRVGDGVFTLVEGEVGKHVDPFRHRLVLVLAQKLVVLRVDLLHQGLDPRDLVVGRQRRPFPEIGPHNEPLQRERLFREQVAGITHGEVVQIQKQHVFKSQKQNRKHFVLVAFEFELLASGCREHQRHVDAPGVVAGQYRAAELALKLLGLGDKDFHGDLAP